MGRSKRAKSGGEGSHLFQRQRRETEERERAEAQEEDDEEFILLDRRPSKTSKDKHLSEEEDEDDEVFDLAQDGAEDSSSSEEEDGESGDDNSESLSSASSQGLKGEAADYDDIEQLAENLPASLRQKVLMGTAPGLGSDEGSESNEFDDSDEDKDAMEIRGLKGSKEGWGKKKNYYAGDTADLEIGQDVQDAYDEEEAAISLQKERLESMQENDYVDDVEGDAGDDENRDRGDRRKRRAKDSMVGSLEAVVLDEAGVLVDEVPRGDSKLSKRQRLELLAGELPELLGLSKEMSSLAQEVFEDLTALRSFLVDTVYGDIPRERLFLEYLEAKIVLLNSYSTNVLFAMLLRAEGRNVRAHPVMKQLLEHQYTMRDLKRVDKFWQQEVELLRALKRNFFDENKDEDGANRGIARLRRDQSGNFENEEDDELSEDEDEDEDEDKDEDEDEDEDEEKASGSENTGEDDSQDSEMGQREEEEMFNHFGAVDRSKRIKKRKQRAELASQGSDFAEYEEVEEEALGLTSSAGTGTRQDLKQALQGFAQAQRKTNRENKKVGLDDQLASLEKVPKKGNQDSDSSSSDDEDKAKDKDSDNEGDEGYAPQYSQDQIGEVRALLQGVRQPTANRRRAPDERMDADTDLCGDRDGGDSGSESDSGDAALVESFTAAKKKFIATKKLHYTPAPRYGGVEQSVEEGDKRGASYEIIKNKGLTPHRKKANRNPRVKKRQMYAKAVVARKGQVREVVAHYGNYGGETTGIKANVSKGRKITT